MGPSGVPPDYVAVTRSSYERSVEYFGAKTKSYEPFPGLAAELDAFVQSAPPGPILDLGRGVGRDSLRMNELGRTVIGADLARGFVDGEASNVQLDARRLPFRDRSFGGVWCCAVLLHLSREDALIAMTEIRRVLAESGLAEVSVKAGAGPDGYKESDTIGPRWFTYWTADQVQLLASQSGLDEVEIRSRHNGSTEWLTIAGRRAG